MIVQSVDFVCWSATTITKVLTALMAGMKVISVDDTSSGGGGGSSLEQGKSDGFRVKSDRPRKRERQD